MASLGIGSSQPPCKVHKSQPVPEEAKNNITIAELPDLPDLPLELQEDILARLAVPELASLLRCLSKSWAASRLFRKFLDQKHPKLIAIVGIEHGFRLTAAAFDFASGQWHYRVLGPLQDDTMDEHWRLKSGYVVRACFAHHAGLLCFVFSSEEKVSPIVVGNPLTNEWKALPLQECKDLRHPVLVQLVVDDTTCQYKVTVVYKHVKRSSAVMGMWEHWYVAELYDSATKLWSPKEDGMVYGQEIYYNQLNNNLGLYAQYYNCGSKQFSEPQRLTRDIIASLFWWEQVPEAKFVTARNGTQHMFKVKQEPGEDTYRISEFVTDSTVVTGVREVASYKSSLPVISSGFRDRVGLRVTDRFLLLAEDHLFREEPVGDLPASSGPQTVIRVRDLVTREWHEIPAPKREFRIPLASSYFMCELRWNAIP